MPSIETAINLIMIMCITENTDHCEVESAVKHVALYAILFLVKERYINTNIVPRARTLRVDINAHYCQYSIYIYMKKGVCVCVCVCVCMCVQTNTHTFPYISKRHGAHFTCTTRLSASTAL